MDHNTVAHMEHHMITTVHEALLAVVVLVSELQRLRNKVLKKSMTDFRVKIKCILI